MTDGEYQATPKHVLEHQIMSHGEGKNEREWWACHEIEKLRARVAGYQKDADDYLIRLDELNALRDRIAELEAALLPFAAIADESTASLADNYMYSDCYPMSAFRAAKAALDKSTEPPCSGD